MTAPLRRLTCAVVATSVVLAAASIPACDDDPGSDPDCAALSDDASSGQTVIRISNGRPETIHLKSVGGCGSDISVDGGNIGAVFIGCAEVTGGTLEPSDCEPDFAEIEPGGSLEISWDRRVLDSVDVPVECDSTADELDAETCTRLAAMGDGSHTLRVEYSLEFGATEFIPVETTFDLPTDTVEITITP